VATYNKKRGLIKKVVSLKAADAGLDTGNNPQLTDQAWLKLENARWTRKGAIQKRFGFGELPSTYTDKHAAVYKGDLLIMDRSVKGFEGGSFVTGIMQQMDVFALWNIDQTRHQVKQGGITDQPNTARLEAVALEVRAGLEVNNIVAPVTRQATIRSYDTTSGRLIQQADITSSVAAFHTRLIVDAANSMIWCFYVEIAGGATVRYRSIDSAGVISAEVDTGLDASVNFPLDVVQVLSAPDRVFMGLIRNAAGNAVRICRIDVDTPAYTTVTIAAANVDAVGCWLQDPDVLLWVGAYFDHATLSLRIVGYNTSTFAQIFAPIVVGHAPFPASTEAANVCGIALTKTAGRLWYTHVDNNVPAIKPRVFLDTIDFTDPAVPVVGGTTQIQGKAQLISKPWLDRGGLFIGVTQPDALDYYVLSADSGALVGKSLIFASGTNAGTNDWFISDTITLAAGRYLTSAKRILDADGDTIAGTALEIIDPDLVLSLETAHNLIVGGSLPQIWDGDEMVELGYCLHLPEDLAGVAAVSGGGAVDAGGHFYVYTYQYYDAQNQLYESAPSEQISVTVGGAGTNSVDLTLPCLHNTNKLNVRIAIYRTEAAAAATTTMYFVGTRSNSRILDTVPFTDLLSDAVISTQRTLPTTGGVLASLQPAPGHIQALHQGRLFAVDEENPETVIRYTKVITEGIAPEHNGVLILRIPSDGGDITALYSFMDRLIVFKTHRIYAVSGTGLSAKGIGTGYAAPYLISEAVGCTAQKTVIDIPGGVAFLAQTGIHNITSKLAVVPLGDAVRHQTDNNTYRSGALVPSQHAAVWVSDDGDAIVYDYLYGLWATWTGATCKDCAVMGAHLALVAAGGSFENVRGQTPGAFLDAGVAFPTTMETGIFSFGGLGGFVRLYRILIFALNVQPHELKIAFQYDMDAGPWTDEQTLNTTVLAPFDMAEYLGAGATDLTDDALIAQADPYRQRLTSVRFRIRDAGQGETGESYTLTGIAAVVGLKKGVKRIGPRRTAS